MIHTPTSLRNLVQRDAHRLAQKISLLVMASLVLACQWAQGIIDLATPDEAIATIVLGVIAYVIANRAMQSLVTADSHSEDDYLHMFVIVDPQ